MSEVRSGTQSVERALTILRTFETAHGDLGVTEIAGQVGLSVSTTHRLVRALVGAGLLRQEPRTERYQLGPALVVLGRRAEEALGYAQALPVLEDLAATTGESVNLGICSGSDVLVVLDVASDQPLRRGSPSPPPSSPTSPPAWPGCPRPGVTWCATTPTAAGRCG